MYTSTFSSSSDGKESAYSAGDLGVIPGEDPLEKGMATHSSILACKEVPRIEEPGRLQSMGSQGVQQDWETNNVTFHFQLESWGKPSLLKSKTGEEQAHSHLLKRQAHIFPSTQLIEFARILDEPFESPLWNLGHRWNWHRALWNSSYCFGCDLWSLLSITQESSVFPQYLSVNSNNKLTYWLVNSIKSQILHSSWQIKIRALTFSLFLQLN